MVRHLQTIRIAKDQVKNFVFKNEEGIYCSITQVGEECEIRIYKKGR